MATRQNDPTNIAITMKIAASHMQIMAIASGLPFKWPPAVKGLFRAFDALSSVSEDVINLDCIFAEDTTRSSDQSVVYQTTILILLGPFIFVCAAAVFWSVTHVWVLRKWTHQQAERAVRKAEMEESDGESARHFSHQKKQNDKTQADAEQQQVERRRPTWLRTRQKIIVSLIVVMVLIHPTLTRRSVQLITCERLSPRDSKTYLRSDYGVECWIRSHWVWGVWIGIPFLTVCKWRLMGLSLSLSLSFSLCS